MMHSLPEDADHQFEQMSRRGIIEEIAGIKQRHANPAVGSFIMDDECQVEFCLRLPGLAKNHGRITKL
nr:hypothetical protein [Rhizobium rhizogenes]